MPCHRMMLALSKYRLLKTQTGWRVPSMGVAGDVFGEEQRGADFASASRFVALVLPRLPPITHLPFPDRVPHPFREPLQFIVIAVMSVMSGTFPDTYKVST